MRKSLQKQNNTETLVFGAILTALVIILQYLGQFIHLGPFSISLVLVPIVVGAAMCGTKVSVWLGTVFGVIVLMTDAAAFLAVSIPGTIITVLVKGAACGLAAGLVYNLLKNRNHYLAILAAAIVCPIVNTGVFLIGCVVFFLDTVKEWGAALGFENAAEYMFIGMAGGNFICELAINILLAPTILRILSFRKNRA